MPAHPPRVFAALAATIVALSLFVGPVWAKDGGGGSGGSGGGSSGGSSGGGGGGGSNSGSAGGSGSGGSGTGSSGGTGGGGPGGGNTSGSGNGVSGGGGQGGNVSSGSRSRSSGPDGDGSGSWGGTGQGWTDRGPSHRDQDAARDAVARGDAVPLSRVLPTIRSAVTGNVLDVRLSRLATGALVYDVTVLSDAGEYLSVVVDARRNRIIGSGQR